MRVLSPSKVTRVINDVRLITPSQGVRPATINDVVKNDIGLETGQKSRSELLFADDTLTRIGPETFFSFRAARVKCRSSKAPCCSRSPRIGRRGHSYSGHHRVDHRHDHHAGVFPE